LDQKVALRFLIFHDGPKVSDENFPSFDPEVIWLDVSMEMFRQVDLA
jgi:hypothetical protein